MALDKVKSGSVDIDQLQGANLLPTAWVVSDGGSPILSGFNVDSFISIPATGTYDFTFTTDLDNVNYSVVVSSDVEVTYVANVNVTGFRVICKNSLFNLVTPSYLTAQVFGGKS